MMWLPDASKFTFCYCSQILQAWRDFPHCPLQINKSSTPVISIPLYPSTLPSICHYLTLYYMQPVLAIYGRYALYSHREHWIREYWTTAPRGNTGPGPWESLVTVFSSSNQYTTLFYVYVYLKTHYLICSVDSLTLKSWPTAPWLRPKQTFPDKCTFSIELLTSVLHLEAQGSASTLPWGRGILNSNIISEKKKMWKMWP